MGIYLDNAATTMQKPDCVIEAVAQAMGHMGNSGRGAYGEALDASRMIYETREQLSSLFGLGNPKQAAFSCNSTEALNTAILGLLGPGDHVISTVMEHNSVLRPLYRLEKEGAQISFCPCDEKGRLRMEELPGLVKKNTKALVCTHASNLTGNANDLMTLGAFCKERGLLFIVDASQTAAVETYSNATLSELIDSNPNIIAEAQRELAEQQQAQAAQEAPTMQDASGVPSSE